MKKRIIIICAALLLIIGAVAIITKKKASIASTPTVAAYPMPLEVAGVKEGSILTSSHYLGTVSPFYFSDVAPRITGNILSVNVREGDIVRKGQLLATIDARALKERESAQALDIKGTEAQIAGAKSMYETQQGIYERDEMLFKEGAISREALDRSRAQRDSAFAQVRSLEEKAKELKNMYSAASVETSYARLYSPIDGVVAKRDQEPGDLAVPGKPVVRVECVTQSKVVAQIPQAEMRLMKKGGVVVLSDGMNKMDDAKISRVYPAVSIAALGTIEIDLPARPFGIPSGGSVGVDVVTGKTESGVVAPLNALLENERGSFLYAVEAGKVKVLKVQVLGKNNESVVIRGDIRGGGMVAVGDEGKLLRLSDGMAVLPQKISGKDGAGK
jgi:RND family efflux transporter MFP subunit